MPADPALDVRRAVGMCILMVIAMAVFNSLRMAPPMESQGPLVVTPSVCVTN